MASTIQKAWEFKFRVHDVNKHKHSDYLAYYSYETHNTEISMARLPK